MSDKKIDLRMEFIKSMREARRYPREFLRYLDSVRTLKVAWCSIRAEQYYRLLLTLVLTLDRMLFRRYKALL